MASWLAGWDWIGLVWFGWPITGCVNASRRQAEGWRQKAVFSRQLSRRRFPTAGERKYLTAATASARKDLKVDQRKKNKRNQAACGIVGRWIAWGSRCLLRRCCHCHPVHWGKKWVQYVFRPIIAKVLSCSQEGVFPTLVLCNQTTLSHCNYR